MQPVDYPYDENDPFWHLRPSGRRHTGSDWASPTGALVVAVQPGTIVAIGTDSGNGKYIAQTLPDGRYWSYIHLSEIGVRVGDIVKEGQGIALSGNTGTNSLGPHLHCSLSDSPRVWAGEGNLSDPWAYLNAIPPTPPTPNRKKRRMFAMAAIKGESYTWALWAPGFYYEIKTRTGVTQTEAGAQMNALNAQLVGAPNATITRAQANEIKLLCLPGQK